MSERRLVFVSAGNRHRLDESLASSTHFDVWIWFYGDDPAIRSSLADRGKVVDQEGAKWPNLAMAHNVYDLSAYDSVFVMDDDLPLSHDQVCRLFDLREKYDLWVLQPAFDRRGRVSFEGSTPQPTALLRFVNLVENNAALFRTDKLLEFLDVYDGELTGFGIDLWYMHVLGPADRRYAIVDEIVTHNAHHHGSEGRELAQLESIAESIAAWHAVQERYGIVDVRPFRILGRVWRRPDRAFVASVIEIARTLEVLVHGGFSKSQMLRFWRRRIVRTLRGFPVLRRLG